MIFWYCSMVIHITHTASSTCSARTHTGWGPSCGWHHEAR